jgi:mannose-1-phosphate guanylyltransferase
MREREHRLWHHGKGHNVYTVVSEFGWSDLGTWGSLYTHLPKDTNMTTPTIGNAVKLYDCARNVVHAHDDRLMVIARAGGLHRGEHQGCPARSAASRMNSRSSVSCWT